ncbi:MAG: sugar nucleotide-binding protein [Actinobacteria bacterium]|nr:sugar nucleotide-binding protein [Actinomycetota bacterium]
MLFVTGGSGFLGSALIATAQEEGWPVTAPSSSALDIRDREAVIASIGELKPTAVVHLAYRKDDRTNIVDGSRHVAEAAAASGSKLIHMSTDVVFSGRLEPYAEADNPDPANDYGRYKFEAEQAVCAAFPSAAIVRTSLLYDTEALAPLQIDVRQALESGPGHRPMTFFTDEYRCPAHVTDVAAALVALAGIPDRTGPIHIAGPERISRADFARRTARWLGLRADDLMTSTIAEAGLTRPANVVLDTARAQRLGLTCRSVAASYDE